MSPQALHLEIDDCRDLFLRRLWEPWDHALRLILDEAVEHEDDVANPASPSRQLVVRPQSRAFELSWETVVAYSVVNESYSVDDEGARIVSGRRLVAYETSSYLDHLRRVTWDATDVFGPVLHVGILCLNQTVDVVGFGSPGMRRVPPQPFR